jgi:hypothetical protein
MGFTRSPRTTPTSTRRGVGRPPGPAHPFSLGSGYVRLRVKSLTAVVPALSFTSVVTGR